MIQKSNWFKAVQKWFNSNHFISTPLHQTSDNSFSIIISIYGLMFLAKLCLELGVKLLKIATKIRKLPMSLIKDEKLCRSMPMDVHFRLEYAFSIAVFTEAWSSTNFFVASFIVRSCQNGTIQWFELLASSFASWKMKWNPRNMSEVFEHLSSPPRYVARDFRKCVEILLGAMWCGIYFHANNACTLSVLIAI